MMIRGTTHRCVVVLFVSAFVLVTGVARAAEGRGRCDPGGTMRVVVDLAPPAGKKLAGVKVNLDYPEQMVKIPGFEDRPEVKARVKDTPAGFLVSMNDLDDRLIVALVGTSGLPAGPIVTVELDRCKGAPKAAAKDFHCKVEQASTEDGVLVEGAKCTVRTLSGEITKPKEKSL